VNFDPVWVEPKPAHKPHPPVFIGASSHWAVSRVVEYGDGWYPIVMPAPADKSSLVDLARLGVNRVVLHLPTLNETDALQWIDANTKVVHWAQEMRSAK
jgi:alkanesulfonate monooxygenase SsuD/methylene tetrahydromethanopterin reductase-like flavin-dependent oxidoreductase (luciferase family)